MRILTMALFGLALGLLCYAAGVKAPPVQGSRIINAIDTINYICDLLKAPMKLLVRRLFPLLVSAGACVTTTGCFSCTEVHNPPPRLTIQQPPPVVVAPNPPPPPAQ